jgi:hypothetical protein
MAKRLPRDQAFQRVRTEWLEITRPPALSLDRLAAVKAEAAHLMDSGRWTSGPSDMLSILGRQRDELTHSRLIGWLVTPTGRHGLGRSVLMAVIEALWPGEGLMRTGPVIVETEVNGQGLDPDGRLHMARADIIVRGDGETIVIENKLDAGEQPDQCERLYWSWAGEPGETRWLFLSPSGRRPATASSEAARAAWRTMSYKDLRAVMRSVLDAPGYPDLAGRAVALQYWMTLSETIAQ